MNNTGINKLRSYQTEIWLNECSPAQFTLGTAFVVRTREHSSDSFERFQECGALLFQKPTTGPKRVVEPGQPDKPGYLGQTTWRIRPSVPGMLTNGPTPDCCARSEGASQWVGLLPCCRKASDQTVGQINFDRAAKSSGHIPMFPSRRARGCPLKGIAMPRSSNTPDVSSEAAQAARRTYERDSVRRTASPTPPQPYGPISVGVAPRIMECVRGTPRLGMQTVIYDFPARSATRAQGSVTPRSRCYNTVGQSDCRS